jgi:hypothetical protein
MTPYTIFTKQFGHGIVLIRVWQPESKMSDAELDWLVARSMYGLPLRKFYNGTKAIEVQYIPQN